MENTIVTESSWKHFPLDLWSEILSRVPVKSLLRFRCVSKPWRLLIDDPQFCHLHLNQLKHNSDETHLLLIQGPRLQEYGLIVSSETLEPTESLSHNTYNCYYGRPVIWLSRDGLVLLRCLGDVYAFMLWNPSIRKSRHLPRLPGIFSSRGKTIELGLGFDPLIEDYKLVRVSLHNKGKYSDSVAVYTVGTNTWKKVRFQGRGCSNKSWPSYAQHWLPNAYKSSVYFKGGLYFISDSKELVSFDLSTEIFTFANLLVYDADRPRLCYRKGSLGVVDGGCSLVVITLTYFGGSIWALDTSNCDATSLCWTKRYTFTTTIYEYDFFYLNRRNDLLYGFRDKEGHQLISYNIDTQENKCVLLPENICSAETEQMCSYKESLVLLKDPGVCSSICFKVYHNII